MNDDTERQWEPRRISDCKRQDNEFELSWRKVIEEEPELRDKDDYVYVIQEILPGDDETSPWDRWCAQVFNALKNPTAHLTDSVLGLAVPQSGCSFSFGTQKSPLPAGAPLRLWEKDLIATGECPLCRGQVVVTAFGGLLNVGGYKGICLNCAVPMFKRIGGLGRVNDHVRAFLEGTPWYMNGALFGGAVTSDGKVLAQVLGLPKAPKHKAASDVSLKIGKYTLPATPVEIIEEK